MLAARAIVRLEVFVIAQRLGTIRTEAGALPHLRERETFSDGRVNGSAFPDRSVSTFHSAALASGRSQV